MANGIVKYFREIDHGEVYGFRYVKSGDKWTIQCVERPPNPRGGGATRTHVFDDGKLCITGGREPKTFEQAVARSWQWLIGYSQYIRSGGSFPNDGVRAITPDFDEQGNRI